VKINKVTITGADDNVYWKDLIDLYNEFNFVEFGILFSGSKMGGLRYPSLKWIDGFQKQGLNISAHLCGSYSREILEDYNFNCLENRKRYFKRFQLNYNFGYNDKFAFSPIIDWATYNPNNDIIFQFNKSNKIALLPYLDQNLFPTNIHILYDASGGRGRSILENPLNMPFKNYTGYSGGIAVANLKEVLEEITSEMFTDKVWIDLETGARTENKFDLNKVRYILKSCKGFINE
jgi:hypothetical protein